MTSAELGVWSLSERYIGLEITGREWVAFLFVALLESGVFHPEGSSRCSLSLCGTVMLGMWTCLTNKGRKGIVTRRVTPSMVKKAVVVLHVFQMGMQKKGGGSQRSENLFFWKPIWIIVKTLFSWFTFMTACVFGKENKLRNKAYTYKLIRHNICETCPCWTCFFN